MRYPSLTVAAVLFCAHLGVPSSLDATSTGNGAPAKIGVVDAAAAFVVPSNRHRNSLPTHSSSITTSNAFETNLWLELKNVQISPASRKQKQTSTHLPSSIIDAPQTLSTSHEDDDNDGESFDAKLEADAEAFFEQMMARRSSIMQGSEAVEPVASVEEEEKASVEAVSNISEETALGISDSTTLEASSFDDVESVDHFESKSDDEIAEEWHNDQMANALASVQSMNGLAALESIEQEESRVHYKEWEQKEAEKQKVYEQAHLESVGSDGYAFQRSRLERQLIQPKTEDSVCIAAVGDAPDKFVDDFADKSTGTLYSFQQARLQRQLAQPRPLTPHPPSLEKGPNQPPSSDEPTSDISTNSIVNFDAETIAFQQARLARQLAQPQSSSTEISTILHDTLQDKGEILHQEVPKSELAEEEIQARRAYYKRIEALSGEIIHKASKAADRVLEEQHRQESETLDAIKEAVALSAQSESTEISSGVHLEDKGETEAETDMTVPMRISNAMIYTQRWDVDEDVIVDEAPSPLVEKEIQKTNKKPSRRSTTIVIAKKSAQNIHSRSAAKDNIDNKAVFARLLPERSLTDLSDEADVDIARYAAIHFTRAAFDTTRAAAFTLGAVFEALRHPETNSAPNKEAVENSALATKTSAGNNALSFLKAIGRSDASKQAVEAASSAAHQYSSFLAACGALGLRAGVKAKVYAEDYKQQMAEAQKRIEEAKAEEKRKMLAKIAKLAEEKRLEEERIAAEKRRMELIRKQEKERIAAEKKALAELKVRIENEKKQVEEERIADEQRAIEDIRRRAEERQRSLDLELEKNGLVTKKIVEIKNSRQEKTISQKPSPLFFVEEEKATPFFFVDE